MNYQVEKDCEENAELPNLIHVNEGLLREEPAISIARLGLFMLIGIILWLLIFCLIYYLGTCME